MKRFTLCIILIILTFILPWYISMPLAVIGIIIAPTHVELLLVGLTIDALYVSGPIWGISYPMLVGMTVIMITGHYMKKIVRA